MIFDIVAAGFLGFWWWAMLWPFREFIEKEKEEGLWAPWTLLMICLQVVTLLYIYFVTGLDAERM